MNEYKVIIKTPIGKVRVGDRVRVQSDDRPSDIMTVTVLCRVWFEGWYEIIDTDGNHWQFNNSDLVEVES